jgi:hypothetical protein
MIANFIQLLPNYFEPAKLILRFIPNYVFFVYKMLKAGVPDTLPKSVQFIFDAFGQQFDPAIGQIPNRASDFESVRDRFDAVTEPNALHGA